MRILLDILHPKHVHFFRPLILRWQKRGDVVQILTRDKDITHQLLEQFGLPFVCLSHQRETWHMAVESHVQGVMAAHGEFLCNNSSIKGIGNMSSCRPADRCPHE